MADNWVLYSPAGSPFQLASYVRVDEGLDFGEADLFKSAYAENPAAEGAAFAFETVNHRTFTFPMRIASGASAMSLQQLESCLRLFARPGGAYIDLQPDGVASAESVRFDILNGRYELDFNSRMNQQLDRRDGTLKLDVQPFGYWPTWITIASSASVGLPGLFAIPTGAGSVFGDVPGFARLIIQPTSPTTYGFASWYIDTVHWSFSGQGASFKSLWSGASIMSSGIGVGATLQGDAFAISSQGAEAVGIVGWNQLAQIQIPASLAPAYFGRFRLWLLAKLSPSQALPWYMTADILAGSAAEINLPLASAAPIATLYPALASGGGSGGVWPSASPGYQLLDLGEINIPLTQSGSGLITPFSIRFWSNCATSALPVATTNIRLDSAWFQPLPMAGGLARNLTMHDSVGGAVGAVLTNQANTCVGIRAESAPGRVLAVRPDASQSLIRDLAGDYRGAMPYLGASVTELEVAGFARRVVAGATVLAARTSPAYAAVSLEYRPRFTFMKGL